LAVAVQELDADFYVFSGHKIYGPTGIGVLYGKEKWLNAIPPYQGGGEMISTVTFEKTTYSELPFKFEAGTPDYVGSTALAEALRYVDQIGLDKIAAYENELLRYAEQRLKEIENIHIYWHCKNKSSVLSFLVMEFIPYDIGMLLDNWNSGSEPVIVPNPLWMCMAFRNCGVLHLLSTIPKKKSTDLRKRLKKV
jgi:cysteine desulfurase/selenocysteine lyase